MQSEVLTQLKNQYINEKTSKSSYKPFKGKVKVNTSPKSKNAHKAATELSDESMTLDIINELAYKHFLLNIDLENGKVEEWVVNKALDNLVNYCRYAVERGLPKELLPIKFK